MLFSLDDIMEYIEENDVKFIRLVFFDIFGSMKNISIIASELPRALKYGVTFDASEINGFMNIGESDLMLRPDPATVEILPLETAAFQSAACVLRHLLSRRQNL